MHKQDQNKDPNAAFQDPNYNPYAVDKLSKIPAWVKVFGAKFIISGSVCYYFYFALSLGDPYLQVLITGIVLGLATDIFTNHLIAWTDTPTTPTKWYRAVNFDGYGAFLVNLVYGVIIMGVIFFTYEALRIPGLEPFLFAVFYLLYDGIWLLIRTQISRLMKKINGGKKNVSNN